ncbi:uncharacterized protein LOC134660031 [Cydia amplana]|uniref:uncharacterized protein LOC134660031 n=1 Tax=Cydia amplana TaxID=1869771 RepID=UPI002FE5E731
MHQEFTNPPMARLKSRRSVYAAAATLTQSSFDVQQLWKQEWKRQADGTPAVNTDPTIMYKGTDLPRKLWCRLNRLRTGHGRCNFFRHKWGWSDSALCDCGIEDQTMEHIIQRCPLRAYSERRPPPPLPLPGGGCVLPGYPVHGEYRVADHARARPGDRVAGDNVVLLVTCDEPYRAVDPYVICVEGRWRHGPPNCLRHCKLTFDPTVEYRCLKAFKDEFLACATWQPDGAVVAAACRPGHAHRGPFRYMRCRGDVWDHVVSCVPNANFTTS